MWRRRSNGCSPQINQINMDNRKYAPGMEYRNNMPDI